MHVPADSAALSAAERRQPLTRIAAEQVWRRRWRRCRLHSPDRPPAKATAAAPAAAKQVPKFRRIGDHKHALRTVEYQHEQKQGGFQRRPCASARWQAARVSQQREQQQETHFFSNAPRYRLCVVWFSSPV